MFKDSDMLRPFMETNREINVREHARLQGITPATSSKYLRQFYKQGILSYRNERNLLLYSAAESLQFRSLKTSWNIERIREAGLVQFLVRELREPLAVFLFGSFAKGENTSESDIDIFVLTATKRSIDVSLFEKQLRTTIQLVVCAPEDIVKLRKKNPHLLNNIVNGIRLHGFWEVF